ncbi:hypothetical protein, partial [Salmonella enterica]|uniref:hypothetical protein n=1 Tax=Salmonella enterica TaxID=28901 RepID=UPI0039EB3925
MSIRQLPSGAFQARLTLNGRAYTATLPTRQDAEQWELLTRAKAITGSLPTRVTVAEYAERWMATYD